MSATKILWGQLLAVCGTVLLFVWAATEWTAYRLAFQPELGPPWFRLLGWPIYRPHEFFWWWFGYDAYAHAIFVQGGYIAATGGVMAFLIAVAMSVWRARETKRVTTYGSARWADPSEIRKAGLIGQDFVAITVALQRGEGEQRIRAMDLYERLLDAGTYGADRAARESLKR